MRRISGVWELQKACFSDVFHLYCKMLPSARSVNRVPHASQRIV